MTTPVTLPMPLAGHQISGLGALMHEVVIPRADTSRNLAGYITAAATSAAPSFGLAQLARDAPDFVTNPGRTFRNLFANPRWHSDHLVNALYGAAPLADVKVVLLEYELVRHADSSSGVVSLHALGDHSTVPLDWRRFCAGEDDHDEELQRCVHELVDGMLERYFADRGTALPVVVALHPEIGEWRTLRQWVEARVGDCGMVVTADYSAGTMSRNIFAERNPGGRLADFFEDWPLDDPPRPVPLKRGGAQVREFAVPFPDGQTRSVAIVSPARPFPTGLQGRRLEDRAAEVGRMLSSLQHQSVTYALRLNAFRHPSHDTFRRHALLMSALHAFLTGHLPKPVVARVSAVPNPS